MTRWRAAVLTRLWTISTWLAARRRPRSSGVDFRRQLFRSQTRGMNLRITEWVRDRLRPSWLRLRTDAEDDAQSR